MTPKQNENLGRAIMLIGEMYEMRRKSYNTRFRLLTELAKLIGHEWAHDFVTQHYGSFDLIGTTFEEIVETMMNMEKEKVQCGK